MAYVVLNGAQIKDKAQLHKLLKETLDFPDWYGENLDALVDCLTDERTPIMIEIDGYEALKQNLGSYADAFIKVLRFVQSQNRCFDFKVL